MLVASPDLQRIEEFDPRDRDAGLDRRNRRVAGGFDGRKRAHAGRNRLRDTLELERQGRDET